MLPLVLPHLGTLDPGYDARRCRPPLNWALQRLAGLRFTGAPSIRDDPVAGVGLEPTTPAL